jgi:NADH:ubiquinone oxidoreductase subunit 3 (subunit A)
MILVQKVVINGAMEALFLMQIIIGGSPTTGKVKKTVYKCGSGMADGTTISVVKNFLLYARNTTVCYFQLLN